MRPREHPVSPVLRTPLNTTSLRLLRWMLPPVIIALAKVTVADCIAGTCNLGDLTVRTETRPRSVRRRWRRQVAVEGDVTTVVDHRICGLPNLPAWRRIAGMGDRANDPIRVDEVQALDAINLEGLWCRKARVRRLLAFEVPDEGNIASVVAPGNPGKVEKAPPPGAGSPRATSRRNPVPRYPRGRGHRRSRCRSRRDVDAIRGLDQSAEYDVAAVVDLAGWKLVPWNIPPPGAGVVPGITTANGLPVV